MNKYNPNIHHRRSIRLKGYDYSQAGLYFITICCQDRKYLFGEVVAANAIGSIDESGINPITENDSYPKMVLNHFGQIAYDEWLNTTAVRNNVELGEFIIMPNHMHAIIKITDSGGELHSPDYKSHSPKLQGTSQTVGAIVRGYKSAVTKQLNLLNIGCTVWQRNYYEHIIRHERAYQNISNYIINNPAKWAADKFYMA